MLWGRLWGNRNDERGFPHPSTWGAEGMYNPGRVEIRKVRTRIIPCDSCRRVSKCAMYHSFTRHRLHGEYSHGTNILHMCDIYLPNNAPSNVMKSPHTYDRTSGKQPT